MIKVTVTIASAVALTCLAACGSDSGGAASSAKPSTSAAAKSSAVAATSAAPAANAAPELAEVKNDKRKLSFKAPKDLKADAGGESYSWGTMQIMVEQTLEPIAKNEDLMKVAPGTTTEGATPEASTEGDVLISTWKQKEGPAWAVCGPKGKSVALRIAFEPEHKEIALGMCKSLKAD
ncbi:MAG TPA: hypothetical protein VL400_27200 [Polyangiaceae bacterium]|nr:hypothetical protein [Polyangiaceae bacterium]